MRTFVKLTLFFSVYSIIGWLCESIYCSIPQKRWINRGFLSGPLCPVYSFGTLLTLAMLSPLLGVFEFSLELIVLFFAATLLTSVLEYVTSVLLEKLFHTSQWDYSNHKYQIHGHVCPVSSLLFGMMSTLVLKVLHLLTSSLLAAVPRTVSFPLADGLFICFILDSTVTAIGILRMNGKLAQLQMILDEIRERTTAVAGANLAGLEHSLGELRDKTDELKLETPLSLRQALEELRLKMDDVRTEGTERLRDSILDFVNDKGQIRLRMLQDKQEYLGPQTHPMRRRIMEAFPHMRSIQSPEFFQCLRQATAAARRRMHDSGSEPESESGDKKE